MVQLLCGSIPDHRLADIRFAYILKALCFFYYCFFLPFIWLGKKIWWGVFKDTAAKKEAARKAVLNQAKKKGKLEKYGIIDLAAELRNVEEERNELRGEGGNDEWQQDTATSVEKCVVGENVKQTAENAGCAENDGRDKSDSKSKEDDKKQQCKSDKDKNSKAKSNSKGTKDTENVELKKEKQSGKCMTGVKGTEENTEIKKEKKLEQEMKGTDDAELKEKRLEKGVRGTEENVELKKKKQLEEGVTPSEQKCKGKKERSQQKESPGYGESSRDQGRSTGRSAIDSGKKSSKQGSTSRSQGDKQKCERMPRGSGKSTVKAKEFRSPKSTSSKAASHDYERGQQQGKQSPAKSEESLPPTQKAASQASKGSDASITQLDDDTVSKNDNKSESVDDARKDSHTSLASVDGNKPDDKVENLSSKKSISSQEGSPRKKSSVDEIKSDMSSNNLERENDPSTVPDAEHDSQQPLDAVSPHHSEEIKPISSDQSEVAEPLLSQHSDMAMKSHHSDATLQPISSQQSQVGAPPRTDPISSGSDNDMKSISRESSVRVQRVSSDQFAVRYLSEGQISVVMQPSHHSLDSDSQAHSRSEEIKQHKSSSRSSVERRSLDSVNSSKSSGSRSRMSMYSDPSLSSSSFSHSNSNAASTQSSSTNTDSKKSSSATSSSCTGSTKSISTSSASSSSSATGTSSSYGSAEQTSSSSRDSDLSKTGDSHSSLSNQLLDATSAESRTSGMVSSQQSEHSNELQESESSQHSEVESRSETTYSEESEEFPGDEHVTSSSSSGGQESSEYSNESQESHSETTESASYTSASTSQQSTTSSSSSSRSQSEDSISQSHSSGSGSSTRSMSSVSSASAETAHSS